jgi:hypothetical protein
MIIFFTRILGLVSISRLKVVSITLLTYPCGHFGSKGVVAILISLRKYMVMVSLEAHAIIPIGTTIGRPNSGNLPQNLWIIGNKLVRANSDNRA